MPLDQPPFAGIPGALDELHHGDLLAAVVLKASTKEVVAYRRGQEIRITGKGLGFVAPMLAEKAPQSRRVRRGAIIRLRSTGKENYLRLKDEGTSVRAWLQDPSPASRRQARLGQLWLAWLRICRNQLAVAGLIIVVSLILAGFDFLISLGIQGLLGN